MHARRFGGCRDLDQCVADADARERLAVARVVLDAQGAGGGEAGLRAGARAGELELEADAAGRESSQWAAARPAAIISCPSSRWVVRARRPGSEMNTDRSPARTLLRAIAIALHVYESAAS